ncbi:HTH domain-containing protein, Cro/C1-type [Desulfonema limicola]|uniref:HTH domain-containing protein, Cro/C1-type n=1 Tax=Desulfonema limicola TaxID=45656 RepID=A0A975BEY8_9BACT|nr:helix-turn-helix domain-containing protein [Desulfonema limicola]QTA83875.1 HTH domain-containing protein, Cro/C1-type [Desulfonema limicola]
MVKFNLKKLISEQEFKEKRRISVREISEITGISKTTLSLIANSKGDYKTNSENIEKLCQYFNCTPNDLMTIVPDPPDGGEQREGEKVK